MTWNWQPPHWPRFHWQPGLLDAQGHRFIEGASVAIGNLRHLSAPERESLGIALLKRDALGTAACAGKYTAITGAPPATVPRDLAGLVHEGALHKNRRAQSHPLLARPAQRHRRIPLSPHPPPARPWPIALTSTAWTSCPPATTTAPSTFRACRNGRMTCPSATAC